MALYSKPDLAWKPPWYWAPYVYGVGLADGWREVAGKKHKEVLHAGVSALKTHKHRIFRLISSIILLLLLYVFIAKWIIAPAVLSGAVNPSSSELLWWTGAIAFGSVAFIGGLIIFKFKRHVSLTYRRGLKVLHLREESLHRAS